MKDDEHEIPKYDGRKRNQVLNNWKFLQNFRNNCAKCLKVLVQSYAKKLFMDESSLIFYAAAAMHKFRTSISNSLKIFFQKLLKTKGFGLKMCLNKLNKILCIKVELYHTFFLLLKLMDFLKCHLLNYLSLIKVMIFFLILNWVGPLQHSYFMILYVFFCGMNSELLLE